MTMRLFRNRWYRIYFELLDSFGASRCPLCHVLAQKEQAMITALLAPESRNRREMSLKELCGLHKARIKETGADASSLLSMLKTVVKHSLRQVAHPAKNPQRRWSRWRRPGRIGCQVCRRLCAEEKAFCRALIQFLADADFWKRLQRAPLLCLDHLQKCLAMPDQSKGFERLLNDQSAKLNALLNDLVRFEATGTDEECKVTALRWLIDFVGPPVNDREPGASSGEDNIAAESASQAPVNESAGKGPDQERLLFENEKLRRKVRDLLDDLNDVEGRAASLHYRVAQLSDVNKRLEMAYTGASTQANGLKELVQNLRAEIKGLEERNAESRAKAVS